MQALGAAQVLASVEVSGVAQTACPLPSSPKYQWKMFHKVISSFRLEADSLPGLVPTTKVNKRHCRKLLTIKYTHTHTHMHSWKRQLDFSACLYQLGSSKEKQGRALTPVAECWTLRACVAMALCILHGWIYRENKTKTEQQCAYMNVYMCAWACAYLQDLFIPAFSHDLSNHAADKGRTGTSWNYSQLECSHFPISAHKSDTQSLAFPGGTSWMSNQSQCQTNSSPNSQQLRFSSS